MTTSLLPPVYRAVLGRRSTALALLAGVALRLPGAAVFPALTLLCVSGLGTSYAQAGLASAAYTLTGALVSPSRGRAIDRHGVRRVGLPLVPVNLAVWLLIGHVSYPWVVLLSAVAAAASLPFWGIARQLVLRSADPAHHSTALSLDSVGTELAYIAGPAIGIGLATAWSEAGAVLVTGLSITAGMAALVVADPLVHASPQDGGAVDDREDLVPPLRRPGVPALLVLGAVVATTLVGTDLLLLAQLREVGRTADYAWVAGVWAGGSMVGGLLYGARQQGLPAAALTIALGLLTVPVAAATTVPLVAVTAFVAGLANAPVLTAVTHELTTIAPASQHTETLGWYSSAHTVGASLGSVGVGAMIDASGPSTATLATALGGVTVALVTTLTASRRAVTHPTAG